MTMTFSHHPQHHGEAQHNVKMNWRRVAFESYRAAQRRATLLVGIVFVLSIIVLIKLDPLMRSGAIASLPSSSNSTRYSTSKGLYASAFDTVGDFVAHTRVSRERLLDSTLQAGSWIGNTWIPPRGWQDFSAPDLRTIYKQRSVLWLGDSTARRTAATMHAVLNYDTNNVWKDQQDVALRNVDNPTVNAVDHPLVIDLHRNTHVGECVRVPVELRRHAQIEWCRPTLYNDIDTRENEYAVLPNLLEIAKYYNYTMQERVKVSDKARQKLASQETQQYHYMFGWQTCLANVEKFVRAELATDPLFRVTSLVDTLVIAVGIWDIVEKSRTTCADQYQQLHPDSQASVAERLETLLAALQDLQSPRLEIVWRTTGFANVYDTRKEIESTNQRVRDIITSMQYPPAQSTNSQTASDNEKANTSLPFVYGNLTIVDWSTAVEPRSFAERISGDTELHYGLEPRMVMMQMMTNHWLERRRAGF
jgi:hypothetical protein